jgi:predicted dehydrogenase
MGKIGLDKKLRVAVIGAGKLGQHHARIYSKMLKSNVSLVAVCDANRQQAEKISSRFGTAAYTDYHDLLDKVDAVSIAVPTSLHYGIGKEIILRGIHCLIEKPLTAKLTDAEELVRLSNEKNVILQVGHIERFNPAVMEAQKYVKDPRFIEAQRLGPYDPRIEVGVVLDVMIHDLDIALHMANSKIRDIQAQGAKVFTKNEDIVKVRISFENGCVADLTASRISQGKYRRIRIFQPDAYISINYVGKSLKICRKKKPDARCMDDIELIRPKLRKSEPLRLELEHFMGCVREGTKPLVSGEHGRNAVEVALEIIDRLNKAN